MVRTPAQKKAVAAASKKLSQARKSLGSEAGAITRRIGGGRTSSGGSTPTITEVSPGVFRVRDPKTGTLRVTSSRSFAESIAGKGFETAQAESKAEGGGRSGRSRTRFETEVKRRGIDLELQREEQSMIKSGLGQQVLDKRAGTISGQLQLEQKGLNEKFGTRTDLQTDFKFPDRRRLTATSFGDVQLIAPPSSSDIVVASLGLGGQFRDDTFIIPDVVKGRSRVTPPSFFGQGTIEGELPQDKQQKKIKDKPIDLTFGQGTKTDFGAIFEQPISTTLPTDTFIDIGQLRPPKEQPSGLDFGQGTSTDFGQINLPSQPPLIFEPSIVRRRIDSGDSSIPTFQDVFVSPGKKGKLDERTLTGLEQEAITEASQFLEIPKKRTGVSGVEQFFETRRQDVQTGTAAGLGLFLGGVGAGFASSVIGSARFAGALATDPLGTGRQFLGSLKDIPQGLTTIGQLIRTEPGFVGGFALGEFAQFKGGQLALGIGREGLLRTKDIFRTRGLKEIPFESITVSEPFAQAPFGTSGKQLAKQFAEQRIVTKGGVDKIIQLPGEVIGDGGVRVFTASKSGPRGQSFIAGFGSSREPGPFFSPQLSKEFLGKGVTPQSKFFGLGGLQDVFSKKGPIAFRTTLSAVEEVPSELLKFRRSEIAGGLQKGFKGFATPGEQSIVSFRASFQDPTKALISTRFSLQGGEIEAIGRAGAVFERGGKPRFFSTLPSGRRFVIEDIAPTGKVLTPEDLVKRARGTAVVKTDKGILLTFAEEEGKFVLPGGGVDPGEIASTATARELLEETGLKATSLEFVGSVEGPIKRFGARRPKFKFVKEDFQVFNVEATGIAKPTEEVSRIGFFKPGSNIDISTTTREILELTGDIKKGGKGRGRGASRSLSIDVEDLGKGQFSIEDLTSSSRESFLPKSSALVTPQRLLGSSVLLGSGSGSSGFKLPTRKQNLSSIFGDVTQTPSKPTGVESVFGDFTPAGSSVARQRDGPIPGEIIPPLFPQIKDPFKQKPRQTLRKSDDAKKKKFKKQRQTRFIDPLAPSFTGIVQFDLGGITGGELLKSGRFGRSPADIRFVPKSLVGATRGSGLSFGGFGSKPKRKSKKKK